jgi:hypothetical protein
VIGADSFIWARRQAITEKNLVNCWQFTFFCENTVVVGRGGNLFAWLGGRDQLRKTVIAVDNATGFLLDDNFQETKRR